MPRREKPWDVAMSSQMGNAVRKRRLTPDGVERDTGSTKTAAGVRNAYPWGELEDGDFFYAPMAGSREAQLVAFRQAAARHDMEISVSPEPDENRFRVIRVIGNISRIKAAAREKGANAPSSDISAFYRRQAAWRRGEGGTSAPAISIAPTPDDAPPMAGTAPVAPLGTEAEERAARAAKLAEVRRRAQMELAGLDPDEDEDIMGVGNA